MKKNPITFSIFTLMIFGVVVFLSSCEKDPVPTADSVYEQLGRTVTFTNASLESTSWEWDFGDGETSTEMDPIHTYAVNGTYSVMLKAKGPGGSNEYTVSITVAVSLFVDTWTIDSLRYQGHFDGVDPYDFNLLNPIASHWASYVFMGVADTLITSGTITFNLDGSISFNGTASTVSSWTEDGANISIAEHALPSGSFTGILNASNDMFTLECGPFGMMDAMPLEYSGVWGGYSAYLNNDGCTFYGSLAP